MFEALQRANARRSLERAFAVTTSVEPLEFETIGLLTRHLCVVCAGVLEEHVRLHVAEYARVKSFGFVASFVSSRISRTTNLNTEKLTQLLREFDASLAEEMEQFMDDRRKEGLNSLMSVRHTVAHGKDNGVSLHRIRQYKDIVLEILDKADEMFTRMLA